MLELFSICPGGAWGIRFLREPTSLTLLRCTYERKLFLKFYILNPGNYFLIWAPNPETIYKTRPAFTNPKCPTRIAVNHLKSRGCPKQVSHVLTKRERERLPGCWCRHSSFSFVLRSLIPHLRISLCFFLAFQSLKNFNISKCMSICGNSSYIFLY